MDAYKDRIKLAHIKDAEFNPTAKQGVYGGYQPWIDRAGRFRSLGDGQVALTEFSPNWPQTTLTAGRCSNGSAV